VLDVFNIYEQFIDHELIVEIMLLLKYFYSNIEEVLIINGSLYFKIILT